MTLFEFLEQLAYWHWIVLAAALFGLEALGASGFLLGMACSALIIALLKGVMPTLSWEAQLSVFSFLSLVITVVCWLYLKPFNEKSDHQPLNQRAAALAHRPTSDVNQAIT